MRLIALALLLMTLQGMALGQATKTEVTSAASPADTMANSPTVPDVYAITGQFERVVVVRLKYQTDLLAGIQNMMKEEKIRNAVILAGTGSVRNYHFHVPNNRTFPSRNVFVKDSTAPADIVGMNGYVIDGRVHAHITLSDPEKAFGGHLESGTNVFTFAIVTVGVLKEGISLNRVDDKTYR